MTFNILFPILARLKMNVIPQASLFLGVIPALILLYISLKGYDGLYKEKLIFLTFVAGIIIGFIAVLIEYFTRDAGLIIIILFPIVEQLFKVIIVNLRRFQGKHEAVIYGLTLGLGFGAIFVPFSMIVTSSFDTSNSYTVILGFIGSLGYIFLHGATGVFIGYGIYIEKLFKYYIYALIVHIPLSVIGLIFIEYYYVQIGLVIYTVIIFWYATQRVMPVLLSQSNRRKRSKKN